MTPDQFTDIREKLGVLLERSANTNDAVAAINRTVNGNGQPGLKQRIERLEEHKNKTIGGIAVVSFIGTSVWGFLEWMFHFRKVVQ